MIFCVWSEYPWAVSNFSPNRFIWIHVITWIEVDTNTQICVICSLSHWLDPDSSDKNLQNVFFFKWHTFKWCHKRLLCLSGLRNVGLCYTNLETISFSLSTWGNGQEWREKLNHHWTILSGFNLKFQPQILPLLLSTEIVNLHVTKIILNVKNPPLLLPIVLQSKGHVEVSFAVNHVKGCGKYHNSYSWN